MVYHGIFLGLLFCGLAIFFFCLEGKKFCDLRLKVIFTIDQALKHY